MKRIIKKQPQKMETPDFEQLKKELGNITDQEFLQTLESDNETLIIETYEVPEINGLTKLYQFRETFIIHAQVQGFYDRFRLTYVRLTAVKCFTQEAYLLRTYIVRSN